MTVPCYCGLAEPCDVAITMTELVESLPGIDIVLQNPRTGLITVLDEDGASVATTAADIQKRLASEEWLIVQFWLNEAESFDCSFARLSNGVSFHSYELSRGAPEFEERLARMQAWSTGYFRRRSPDGLAELLLRANTARLESTGGSRWAGIGCLNETDASCRLPASVWCRGPHSLKTRLGANRITTGASSASASLLGRADLNGSVRISVCEAGHHTVG